MAVKNICLLYTGGTIGMIRDADTGVYYPPQDPVAFQNAVPELAHLPEHFPEERPHFADFHIIANLDSTNILECTRDEPTECTEKWNQPQYKGYLGHHRPITVPNRDIPMSKIG